MIGWQTAVSGRIPLLLVLALASSPPYGRSAEPPADSNPLFVDDQTRGLVAASTAVAMRDALSTAGLLALGQGTMLWQTEPAEAPQRIAASDKVEPIDAALLAGVQDREPVQGADQNYNEYRAFNYTLLQARKTPVQALARAGRRDLTYAHLFEEPEKYRGQVIHVQGRLRRLRKFDTNQQATKEGVPILYEAWIFDQLNYANPYCVVITELPAAIKVGDAVDYQVACDAYFFKRYRYKAGDGVRDAPLLIGRSLLAQPAAAAEPEPVMSIPDWLLWGFLVFLIATFALGTGLAWWFHRGDRRVRERLDRTRHVAFLDPEQAESP
jgi:hypothetical protein